MEFIETPLSGAYIIKLEPFTDERGLFVRTYCKNEFFNIGSNKEIVQINHSITRKKGTIRGMHYQCPPSSEVKIIRCVNGTVFDVMVDIRRNSPTYLKWFGVEISKKNMQMVYIPEGFAHGFQTITDDAELIYHHSEFYSPEYERGLRFDDSALSITWPLKVTKISEKDQNYTLIDGRFKGLNL